MQIIDIIPEVTELQSLLTSSFKEGREKIIKSAEEELANKVVFKMYASAQQGKRSVEIDWQEMLSDYPPVFRRKAAKAVNDVLVEKGYLVYADGQKGVPWKHRNNKFVNKMTVIVPGQVNEETEEQDNEHTQP